MASMLRSTRTGNTASAKRVRTVRRERALADVNGMNWQFVDQCGSTWTNELATAIRCRLSDSFVASRAIVSSVPGRGASLLSGARPHLYREYDEYASCSLAVPFSSRVRRARARALVYDLLVVRLDRQLFASAILYTGQAASSFWANSAMKHANIKTKYLVLFY